jgi:hypothetical protein
VIDQALKLEVRDLVRREMEARLRSPILNSQVSPRGVSQGRVAKRLVTRLPAVAQEFDEVNLESSAGEIVPFIFTSGSWKPLGAAFQRWSAVISEAGPLPASGTFEKEFDDTKIVLFASGSGFRFVAGVGLMQVTIDIDGTNHAFLQAYTNETGSHKTLVPYALPFPSALWATDTLAKGSHTVTLEDPGDVESDVSDFFYVTALETFDPTGA